MKLTLAILALAMLSGCDADKVPCGEDCRNIPAYYQFNSYRQQQFVWVKVLNIDPIQNNNATFNNGDYCIAPIPHLKRLHDDVYVVHDQKSPNGSTCPNRAVIYWEGE